MIFEALFQASSFPRTLEASPFWRKKRLITLKLELPDRAETLEKKGFETLRGLDSRSLLSSFFGFGVLGKPTGWANQSNERGLAWANRANPCKTYSSRPWALEE